VRLTSSFVSLALHKRELLPDCDLLQADMWKPNLIDAASPPSLPPLMPEAEEAGQHPPLAALPTLVDAAVQQVRLYQYKIPEHLLDALDMSLKQVNNRTARMIRGKHPWINLEDHVWPLLPSSVWTEDPEEATFFVVPHAYLGHSCATGKDTKAMGRYVRDGLSRFLEYLYHAEPYYNRSGGRDHVTTWVLENGLYCDCAFRNEMVNETLAMHMLQSMVKIGYWGHADFDMYGWQQGFDIAMPQFGAVSPNVGPPPTWQELVSANKHSFGFSGSYWGSRVSCPAIANADPASRIAAAHYCECSPGSRTWLHGYLENHCNSSRHHTMRCSGLSAKMGSFWYALCPAAWACWSSRLYHAIDRLAVPAIMANGAIQPFEGILDWSSFAVKLDTKRLMANNGSQLDQLHHDGLAVAHHCASCQTCYQCTRLPLVKRIRQLERVRKWFLYNATSTYSATGLMLLELHCRSWSLKNSTLADGVCRQYPGWQRHASHMSKRSL
jgi:hypothetical protein